MKTTRHMGGFTLVELLIAIAIGAVISTAVLGAFMSVVTTNRAQLKNARLNQELRSTMLNITRDLRRSGFNRSAATNPTAVNPFYTSGTTIITTSASDTAINFAYDQADDGTVETYGYRFNNTDGTVQGCRSNTTACSNWEDMTDGNLVNITALSFTQSSTVINTAISNVSVTVNLTGALRQDPAFTRTLTETVVVRN